MNTLHSERLRLVPATADHLSIERRCPADLGKALQCAVHEAWPPQSVRDVLELFEKKLREHPSEVGWHVWYWVASEPQGPTLVGSGGFKGMPDTAGVIEIGYGTLEPFQRRGFATEAVGMLVCHAMAQAGVTRIVAECESSNLASRRVILKNGFVEAGRGSKAGLIRFSKMK
jgi:RimJ/RimL family protein N-acetyltransferase